VAFALVAGLASAAAAAHIRIRVEGRTTTIYGATQPKESATTPLDALEVAAKIPSARLGGSIEVRPIVEM